ncbi:hypothetical protein R50076_08490 [Gilvimarinus japonicus]
MVPATYCAEPQLPLGTDEELDETDEELLLESELDDTLEDELLDELASPHTPSKVHCW